jgi:hypothetical protein
MIEPTYSIEHDDGSGGDLPGWYIRRTLPTPVRPPPGGNVSIAGPFEHEQSAQRFLRLRLDDGSLPRMLPIPPASLMRRSPTELANGNRSVPAQSPSAAQPELGGGPTVR